MKVLISQMDYSYVMFVYQQIDFLKLGQSNHIRFLIIDTIELVQEFRNTIIH